MFDSTRHAQQVDAVFALAPVIPVITIAALEDAVPLARALAGNGLPVLEVTLRTDCALEAIARIAAELPQARSVEGDLYGSIGAGLAVEAARRYG